MYLHYVRYEPAGPNVVVRRTWRETIDSSTSRRGKIFWTRSLNGFYLYAMRTTSHIRVSDEDLGRCDLVRYSPRG